MGATTVTRAEVIDAASGGSAASAATSGDPSVDVAGSGVLVVVYAAQTHHKAIPHMGNVADSGISASLTLDTRLGYQSTDLEDLGATDRM